MFTSANQSSNWVGLICISGSNGSLSLSHMGHCRTVDDLLKTATAYSEWGSEHLSTSDCHSSDITLHCLLSERIFVGEEIKMWKAIERESSLSCL